MTHYPRPKRSEINGVVYAFGRDDFNNARSWLYKLTGTTQPVTVITDEDLIAEAKERAIDNETVTEVILQWSQNHSEWEAKQDWYIKNFIEDEVEL